jgi:uncharacterized protein (UPF0332 family)
LYNRLFLYRQQSDYQDLFTIDEPMIKEWLADAKVFVADISKLIDLGE